MEALIKVQQDLYLRIDKAKTNFKKSPKERLNSADYLSTRLETLESLWNQFVTIHTQIIQESTTLEFTEYVTEDVYSSAEELFMDYKSDLKAALNKLNASIPGKSTESTTVGNKSDIGQGKSVMVKLPKISIPTFSGDYSEWTSFRDLFKSLIHKNKDLDDVQKLHYLKGYLVGEAEQLLRHVQITQDNYSACWEKLEKRYNNKKYLSNCILKRFMSQKNITTESANALKELLDTTNECLDGLNNLGIDTTTWDIIVIHIICLKLDNESRKQWELKVSESSDDLPTLNQLREFLETRFRALEFLDGKSSKTSFVPKKPNAQSSSNLKVHHVTEVSCGYCSENHKLCNCKGFAKIDVDAQRDFIQSGNFCFNCLGSGHNVYSCRQSTRCRICKRKHHSLLHPKTSTQATDSQVKPTQSVEGDIVAHATTAPSSSCDEPNNVTTCFSTSRGQVFLPTALVQAQSKTGSGITLRCLIDQCSEASFITESAAQLLGLNKVSHKSTVTGLGGEESSPVNSKSVVKVKISSLLEPDFEVNVHAHVLGKVTSNRPRKRIVIDSWSELPKLDLADSTFNIPGKIDLLLGAEVYGQILLNNMIKAPQGALIAQRTSLGWIVSGPTHLGESEIRKSVSVNHIHLDENELLKKFWELEADHNTTDLKHHYTEDEKKCEEFFAATTERDSTGRYIVKLPFRDQDPSCKHGNFVPIATRRLNQLEKRFAKDAEMKKRYSDVINEYLELEHMEEVPPEQENNPDAVYLPHHAVIRDDRSTSKLRVVYDASCPGSNGVSLNQDLLVGPILQPVLRHTILRWRCHPICLVADIVKMYRQVKVHQDDIDFQRILWRENSGEKIKHLRLLRVTFGTASAPHLAVRALQQVAYDEGAQYPNAADRVLKHFYVDDLLTGCESVEEGKLVYQEMNELLKKGGFDLQKWSSNNEELISYMKETDVKEEGSLQLKIDAVMKILGLVWNRRNDEFEYSVQLPPLKVPVTKRSVISDISRLFDPLGWLAPVIIVAKIFIQKLWLSGIEWDDEVPPQLLKDWLNYRESLNQLTEFKLPRWNHASSNVTAEIQGFCDASNEAFAAVVYLRTIDGEGNVHVSLITSKTKVAPIKQISIPRLELCGAVLLTKLLVEVADVMSISKVNIHAWTDSTVVISWLNSRPNRWKTFVANRVSEIITSVEPHQWSHVSSKDNPADCASRGTRHLSNEELWIEGPSWLKNKEINYKKPNIKDTNLEERSTKACFVNTYDNDDVTADAEETLISRFSKLWKLLRVLAFCKRFLKCARKEKVSLWLTSSEIQETLKMCIKIVQGNHFKEELKNLKENKTVNKKSQLTSLNPIVDGDGVLRVGGRLEHAGISEQMKHPVIIPHKSHLTTLILDNAHEKTLHGNPQLMLNYMRSKYYVIGATNAVKLFVRKCVTCARYAAASRHPLMGQLPSVRGTVNRPFFQSGVDYAGPINMRTSKGRGHRSYKGYICLFICMATRAIHLEAVSDLTAQGFIAAFKRFTARRGHCADLWSDNGTNFVGAARELKQLYAEERSSVAVEIADQLATNSTNWHWIPPHSPNFGGLWEAGVKSTKYHLKRVIGDSTLTFEEMATVLAQIEACLNSRPMSRINSSNSNDPIPLTPGHFLVGEPLVLVPDSNYESTNVGSLRRWQLTQKMVQDFWRRWSREYLTQFYHRYKWAHQTPEPVVGSVVLVKEDNLPPARWLYGVVIDKHPGLDGITRVVSLRCKGNIIKRPVGKLCFLPIET
ncbi:uncharacterized protein LOC134790896 [Cydia splendana]|uniref:uncharacterized protein LOC134790896 n=1 Tax=Cydia splendana TaxID=1100963 RepID=UPI00300C15E5